MAPVMVSVLIVDILAVFGLAGFVGSGGEFVGSLT